MSKFYAERSALLVLYQFGVVSQTLQLSFMFVPALVTPVSLCKFVLLICKMGLQGEYLLTGWLVDLYTGSIQVNIGLPHLQQNFCYL